MPAAGHLEHHARTHRTADHVDAGQALGDDPLLEGIGERGDGGRPAHRRLSGEAGQVHRDDFAGGAQRRHDRVPVAGAGAESVDQEQRLART